MLPFIWKIILRRLLKPLKGKILESLWSDEGGKEKCSKLLAWNKIHLWIFVWLRQSFLILLREKAWRRKSKATQRIGMHSYVNASNFRYPITKSFQLARTWSGRSQASNIWGARFVKKIPPLLEGYCSRLLFPASPWSLECLTQDSFSNHPLGPLLSSPLNLVMIHLWRAVDPRSSCFERSAPWLMSCQNMASLPSVAQRWSGVRPRESSTFTPTPLPLLGFNQSTQFFAV